MFNEDEQVEGSPIEGEVPDAEEAEERDEILQDNIDDINDDARIPHAPLVQLTPQQQGAIDRLAAVNSVTSTAQRDFNLACRPWNDVEINELTTRINRRYTENQTDINELIDLIRNYNRNNANWQRTFFLTDLER